jgi:thioredoxin reductase (NADPH)
LVGATLIRRDELVRAPSAQRQTEKLSDMFDCVIIGGGPAGLLAATYMARYRRRTCVIDAGESRARKIPSSHNYPGFLQIGGREILRRLWDQAQRYGVELLNEEVTSLEKREGGLVAAGGTEVSGRFVILATGLVDRTPAIEGFAEIQTSGHLRFCPICDGYEAIDTRVGVLGDVHGGGKKALFLRTYTRRVCLFPVGDGVSDATWREELTRAGVDIAGRPDRIEKTSDTTLKVLTHSGDHHIVDALYPALGCDVRSGLALNLGACCTSIGTLKVDDHQHTTVNGLYAAGDVVTDLHQLSVAFGHAALAATQIHQRLPANPR